MKSLKKIILKNKTILALLGLIVLAASLVFVYINYKTNQAVDSQGQDTVDSQGGSVSDSQVEENVANKKAPEGNVTGEATVPQSSNGSDIAKSISIQGVMDEGSQSATLSLYGMAANYTIEKEVDGSWDTLAENIFYSGRGGYRVDEISNIPNLEYRYRIYPVIDGEKSVEYSEIVVNWNLLVSERVKSFVGAL